MCKILDRINKADAIRARFLGLGVSQMLSQPEYYADSVEQCALILRDQLDELDFDDLIDWEKDINAGYHFSFESTYNGSSDITKKYTICIR